MQFQSNPKAALKDSFNLDTPLDLEVKVIHESSHKIYFGYSTTLDQSQVRTPKITMWQ